MHVYHINHKPLNKDFPGFKSSRSITIIFSEITFKHYKDIKKPKELNICMRYNIA